MPVHQAALLSVLHAHMPQELASTMLERALDRCGVTGTLVAESQIDRVLDSVLIGVQLFAEPDRRAAIRDELQRVAGVAPEAYFGRIVVRHSSDVLEARTTGRSIAAKLGARSLVSQRVSSVVSELGTNQLLHAGGGTIEIRGVRVEPRAVTLIAADRGPGIDDVDSVFADPTLGAVGLGLAGVRRTADRLRIRSDASGTTVEAHIYV